MIVTSCGDDAVEEESCATTGLTYENYAKEALASNCAGSGCHNTANAGNPAIGSFETYADAKIKVDAMRVIGAINHEEGFSEMPKNGDKLDDCTISKLTAWINDGAPEQ
jgi:hypothetical protein